MNKLFVTAPLLLISLFVTATPVEAQTYNGPIATSIVEYPTNKTVLADRPHSEDPSERIHIQEIFTAKDKIITLSKVSNKSNGDYLGNVIQVADRADNYSTWTDAIRFDSSMDNYQYVTQSLKNSVWFDNQIYIAFNQNIFRLRADNKLELVATQCNAYIRKAAFKVNSELLLPCNEHIGSDVSNIDPIRYDEITITSPLVMKKFNGRQILFNLNEYTHKLKIYSKLPSQYNFSDTLGDIPSDYWVNSKAFYVLKGGGKLFMVNLLQPPYGSAFVSDDGVTWNAIKPIEEKNVKTLFDLKNKIFRLTYDRPFGAAMDLHVSTDSQNWYRVAIEGYKFTGVYEKKENRLFMVMKNDADEYVIFSTRNGVKWRRYSEVLPPVVDISVDDTSITIFAEDKNIYQLTK